MKFHCTLIVRTFRGMSTASSWSRALCNSLRQNHPTSVLVNPQIAQLSFRPIVLNTFTFSSATATTNSARRWPNEARTVCSVADKRAVKGNDEYNEAASSLKIAEYHRPQVVPWQKELTNRVHFIGRIGGPVKFRHTQSGKSLAWTSLRVSGGSDQQPMWFKLVFWNELAETAAQHLKENDSVYVSGSLGLPTTAGEDNKLHRYQVVTRTLNFIEQTPYFPSSSSKRAQVESLWQAFFINPREWWDNRTNKRNPRYPDFKHKDTGESLWIGSKSNPSWAESQLALLDSRMKVLEEWEKVGSSARSQGSLSSSHDSGF